MKLFVIAIGGTGMRCLESFVHLCAIGMFDNQEIHILTLDTDQSNGNLGRVKELIQIYNKVKSEKENPVDGGHANVDTFFSAKLIPYEFCTDYSDQTRNTYKQLSHLAQDKDNARQNEDLSALFMDAGSVQQFALEYGYRAQTHLGSLLMYHGIVEAARHASENGDAATMHEKSLKSFVEHLQQNQDEARVFVFGSVFGGTGASSIPVIPKALEHAAQICLNGQTLDTSKAKFGSTLLTNYFTFNAPDSVQKGKDKVVADSNNFALNSQAALQFYQGDPTVQRTYKRFYHIGWPSGKRIDVSNKGNETLVGGQSQRNACHVAELMCACAAYDFFTLADDQLTNEVSQYLYRSAKSVDDVFSFSGADFVANGELFENKLGAFFSLAHIILTTCDAAWSDKPTDGIRRLLNRFEQQNINDYKGCFSPNQSTDLDNYMKKFAYSFKDEEIEKGWIYQVYDSIQPGKFIFQPDAFISQKALMKRISAGRLFDDPRHNWSALSGLLAKADNSFDILVRNMTEDRTRPDVNRQKLSNAKEKFLAHIYNAITQSQKFNLQSK